MKRILVLLFTIYLMGCQAAGPSPTVSPTAAPASTATAPPLSMVFMPGYKPQADLPFVGVYVAQEKGFFAEQNLTVAIQPSPGQGQHLQLTAAGKVQVTTQDAAVMLQRRADPGLPLVSIALFGQRGQQAYAALAKSGLKTPKDWEGHTVGYKGAIPPDLLALISASGADRAKINLINVGFDPRLLLEGKVDVYPVFKSNEPFQLRSWGAELTLWDAADYGVPTLGLVYVTSDETLRTSPELLARFLRAALQGIDYAAAHEDEAVQIVMKYAGPESDANLQRFMLESELKDYTGPLTLAHGTAWQTAEQWQALADMLRKQNALTGTVEINQAFTTQILEMAR
jgi:ABC-type nitrate/sulfonate/bicarbonate transport system substrate-binding protein